jgi:membrane protein implicated in regulation of membrane protease activity
MLLLLAILAAIFWLPSPWGYVAVAGAAVYEVAEFAFLVWYSRRRRATTGAEALPGSVGIVVTPCRPLGQIRLAGELWGARCEEGADAGENVVVEALGPDLTLLVRRA